MLYIGEEPVKDIYVKLIKYACRKSNILSLQIEINNLGNVRKDILDKIDTYTQILSDLQDTSMQYIKENWSKSKCVNKIYDEIKDKPNMPWEEDLKKFKKMMENIKNPYTQEELDKMDEFTIKETIEIMLFIVVGNEDYEQKMYEYINRLQNNIIKTDKCECKPYWSNYDTYYLKIDDFLENQLLKNRALYEWDFPNLPSNICFYKNDKLWLETIAHEEICRIYTEDEEEIEYLKELGYIDDVDYVKSYIKQCEKMQNYSVYEITNKLLQKGVKASIMEQEIDVLKETDYEQKVIDKLINSKLKSYDEMKQKNYLYRRGFRV